MDMNTILRSKLVQEDLECIVCLDVAMSPIHSCKNGHILCGFCVDTVKKCAICEENLSPCNFAERLIKKYDIKSVCKNNESGCKELIRMDQIKEHLPICEYRSIKCFYSKTDSKEPCCEKLFSLIEFSNHLKNQHKTYQRSQISGVLSCVFTMTDLQVLNLGTNDLYDVPDWISFNDQEFLLHSEFREGTFFWWITILGGEKNASQYKYNTFILQKDASTKGSCTWELPVLPVHENGNINRVLKTGKFANIHWQALLPSIARDKKIVTADKNSFELQVKITQLSPVQRQPVP